MRTIPQSIKNALKDKSLPLKKQILMYRRVWNSTTSAYELESLPVDVTHLLQESSSIKMALDTDEVDKWDASNVTLTFKNTLNCFKEGLAGGLFESAVLWGSKFVYLVKNADKNAPNDSVAVFTGYVYSSPVFKENGNFISLTITSSLDALEYVSAEDFCYTKTDELGTLVTSQNSNDQGKEFSTSETGVGYIDSVKYGATLATANTLAAGADYSVSQLSEYGKNAVIKLNFTPTSGYSAWVSYRYWHKDMKIEDIVSALLDVAGITARAVSPAVFFKDVVALDTLSAENSRSFLMEYKQDSGNLLQLYPRLLGGNSYSGKWHSSVDRIDPSYEDIPVVWEAPLFGFTQGVFLDVYDHVRSETQGVWYTGDFTELQFLDANNNGVAIRHIGYSKFALRRVTNGDFLDPQFFYYVENRVLLGFELDEAGNLGVIVWNGSAYQFVSCGNFGAPLIFTKVRKLMLNAAGGGWIEYVPAAVCRPELLSTAEKNAFDYNAFLQDPRTFSAPMAYFTAHSLLGFRKWGTISALLTDEENRGGTGQFYWADSADGLSYSAWNPISLNEEIPSQNPYLRVCYKLTSLYNKRLLATNVQVSQYLDQVKLPLVNLTGLTVGKAIGELAKMVSYEIGFNQDGVFFFRPRSATTTGVEITPHQIISCDNHSADIDNLVNRVRVEFGNFSTVIDDFSEQKPRPHSIDTYGVHEKSISSDNFIPAGNVDISRAVASVNYETLCALGPTVQLECVPDLSLELGDKIRVNSQNTEIADNQWPDRTKFEQLPIWKRVFKVRGIELSIDKRKMVLSLKDVTTAQDVPA